MIHINTFISKQLATVFRFIFTGIVLTASNFTFGQSVTVNCYPQSAVLWTGTCNSTTYTQNSYIYCYGASGGQRGFAKFDVSAIPSSVIINDVKLHFYVNTSANTPYYLISKLTYDPVLSTPGSVFTQIGLASTSINTNTYYHYFSQQYNSIWQTFTLNAYAKTDLQSQLLATANPAWFAVGFYEYESSNIYWMSVHGWNQTNKPYLEVTYTPNFPNDIGIESILPTTPTCEGLYPIKFVIKNYGNNTINNATINWSISGAAQTPIAWTKAGGLPSGGADTVVANPSYNFTSGIVTIYASITNPNGVSDPNTVNNTKTHIIQIIAKPHVLTQPTDQTAIIAGNATFQVIASGGGILYQWQLSTNNGSSWTNVSNAPPYSNVTSNTLNITSVSFLMSGYKYRCIVSGTCDPAAVSNAVTLVVGDPIKVTVGTGYACPGNTALIPVNVKNVVGISSLKLTLNYPSANITFNSSQNQNAALSGGTWSATAAGGKVTMLWSSATPMSIANGKLCDLQFTYTSGTNNLIWDTVTTNNCSFLTAASIDFPADYVNGALNNANGAIIQQPLPTLVGVNETAKFYITCSGAPTYQWQRSTNAGATWANLNNGLIPGGGLANCTGVAADTLKIFQCQTLINLNRFRCIVSGCSNTITSGSGTLQVIKRVITKIDSTWKCVGNTVIVPIKVWNFDSVASMSLVIDYLIPSLTFTGFQNKHPNLANFVINGAIAGTVRMAQYVIQNVSIPDGGTMVELLFTYNGGCTYLRWDTVNAGNCEYSDLNINPLPGVFHSGAVCDAKPFVTAQPTPVIIYAGENASFTVNATGQGTLTYQWQVSTNGGSTWVNVASGAPYSGVTTHILSITGASISFNTYKYRCEVSGQCTPTNSNAVLLTVNPPPIYITPGFIAAGGAGTGINNICDQDTIVIPINVQNCNGICAFSLKLDYDPTKLSYHSFKNLSTALTSPGSFACNSSGGNQVIMSWFSLTPANIGSGVLVKLKFLNVFAGGLFTANPITWHTLPAGSCQISNCSAPAVTMSTVYNPGTINILPLPIVYNVTTPPPAFGHYCSGGSGVQIGMDFSQLGVNYQLYRDGLIYNTIGSIAGDGQGFSFGVVTAAGVYTVLASMGTSACGRWMDGLVSVVIDPQPTQYGVTGTGSFCFGSAGISVGLSNSQTGVNYQLMNGSTPIGSAIAGTGSALAFPAQTTSGTYTVSAIYDIYGTCPTTMTGSAVLTQILYPAAAGTITGLATVCQGLNNVTYTVGPIVGATSGYAWTVPSGASIIAGAGTNSITVNYGTSAIAGVVSVKGQNTCGDGAVSNLTITVNPLPVAPGVITCPATICQGQTAVLISVPPILNATSYVWTLPSGANVSIGLNTANLTVNFTSSATTGPQQITVKGSNSCGVGTTATFNVTINPLPGNAGVITGPVSDCQGATNVSYSVNSISNANTYTWSYMPNVSGTSTSSVMQLNYSNTALSGNITVMGHNACGDGQAYILPVTVNPLPATPASITGPVSVCYGQTGVVYVSGSSPAATSFIWTLPSGATGTYNSNQATLAFGTSLGGNISVKGHNTCGDGQAFNLAVTVNPLPTVTLAPFTSICSEAAALTLSGGLPAGGTYSGIGVTGGSFNPVTAGLGPHPITYTYTSTQNCTNTAVQNMQVITQPRITGIVQYDNALTTNMGNVNLVLKNGVGTVVDNTASNSPTGIYWFRCLTAGSYTIEASTIRPWEASAANATDALLIAQHSVGSIVLSTFRQVAGDVNLSGYLNAADALMVMKRFIGTASSFPAGNWVWNIPNPAVVVASDLTKNIQALMTGDVNGSYTPSAAKSSLYTLESKGQLNVSEVSTYELPLITKNRFNASAMSMVLNFPQDKIEILDVKCKVSGMIWNVVDGQIRLAWYSMKNVNFAGGESVLTLKVRVRTNAVENDRIVLSLTNECMISDERADDVADVVFVTPSIKVGNAETELAQLSENGYSLGNNHPNPFDASTQIEYSIPGTGNVHLSVYNLLGEEIQVLVNQQQSAGNYRVRFEGKGLSPGVYLYKLQVTDERGEFLRTRTMVIKE